MQLLSDQQQKIVRRFYFLELTILTMMFLAVIFFAILAHISANNPDMTRQSEAAASMRLVYWILTPLNFLAAFLMGRFMNRKAARVPVNQISNTSMFGVFKRRLIAWQVNGDVVRLCLFTVLSCLFHRGNLWIFICL